MPLVDFDFLGLSVLYQKLETEQANKPLQRQFNSCWRLKTTYKEHTKFTLYKKVTRRYLQAFCCVRKQHLRSCEVYVLQRIVTRFLTLQKSD